MLSSRSGCEARALPTADHLVEAAAAVVLVTGGFWVLRILLRVLRRAGAGVQRWRRDRRRTPVEGSRPVEVFTDRQLEALRQLAEIYGATFCDDCRARQWPQGRCPACVARLADTITLARQVRARDDE